ncbi:MAG: hypothetical protein AAF493_09570, partial [Pseudomonadota bacterium]
MQALIRTTEEELSKDISGLNDRLEEIGDSEVVPSRRAASFLKQVLKHKIDKRATLSVPKSR